jgi:VanZ family protein
VENEKREGSNDVWSQANHPLTMPVLRFSAIMWALLIALVSTSVNPEPPESLNLFSGVDKLGHFMAYLILSWLIGVAWLGPMTRFLKPIAGFVAFGSASYGMLLEVIQLVFFPGRLFEWADQIANTCGAFAGILIFLYIYPSVQRGGK